MGSRLEPLCFLHQKWRGPHKLLRGELWNSIFGF
jgi:hypothetical protein